MEELPQKRDEGCGKILVCLQIQLSKRHEGYHEENPMEVQRSLMALEEYTTEKAYKDYEFRTQAWNVQFKGLLLEHHHVAVVDEAIADLGTKISTEPKNCRP